MMAAWNTETNFDVLKDLVTFLNSITESKLMLGKAQSGQKALNKYLKNKKLGINLKKKEKRWANINMLFNTKAMLSNFLMKTV